MEASPDEEAGRSGPWTPADGRRFALVMGGAFLALAGLFWWRGHAVLLWSAAGLAAAAGAAALLVPGRLEPVHDAWMAVARAISKVTTPVILGLVYYGVITPAGLLRRSLGESPIRRDPGDESYWVPKDESHASDLRRQF